MTSDQHSSRTMPPPSPLARETAAGGGWQGGYRHVRRLPLMALPDDAPGAVIRGSGAAAA